MSLQQTIQNDLVAAMKAKDAEKTSSLRMLTAALKNKAIEKRTELTDADIMSVIQSEIKKRTDAAAEYEKGGRPELAAKEKSEQVFFAFYLPAQLSDGELEQLVTEVMKETGASSIKDMGAVMKALGPKVQGKADGKRVSDTVKAKLAT